VFDHRQVGNQWRLAAELVDELPRLKKELTDQFTGGMPLPNASAPGFLTPMVATAKAIRLGEEKFTTIPVPALVIFNYPHAQHPAAPSAYALLLSMVSAAKPERKNELISRRPYDRRPSAVAIFASRGLIGLA